MRTGLASMQKGTTGRGWMSLGAMIVVLAVSGYLAGCESTWSTLWPSLAALGHGADYTQCATRAFNWSRLRGALVGGWLGLRRDRAINLESILADFWVFLEIERDALYIDSRWLCCAC